MHTESFESFVFPFPPIHSSISDNVFNLEYLFFLFFDKFSCRKKLFCIGNANFATKPKQGSFTNINKKLSKNRVFISWNMKCLCLKFRAYFPKDKNYVIWFSYITEYMFWNVHNKFIIFFFVDFIGKSHSNRINLFGFFSD